MLNGRKNLTWDVVEQEALSLVRDLQQVSERVENTQQLKPYWTDIMAWGGSKVATGSLGIERICNAGKRTAEDMEHLKSVNRLMFQASAALSNMAVDRDAMAIFDEVLGHQGVDRFAQRSRAITNILGRVQVGAKPCTVLKL